jgi:hypothetical protein
MSDNMTIIKVTETVTAEDTSVDFSFDRFKVTARRYLSRRRGIWDTAIYVQSDTYSVSLGFNINEAKHLLHALTSAIKKAEELTPDEATS